MKPRKYETNLIEIFILKKDTGWWGKGKKGGGTVA